jgi:predicted MFS family arabinose efflux permease
MSEKLYARDFFILAASTFAFFMSFHMLLPILSPYAKQLGAGESEIGVIIGIFALVAVLSRIPYGSYADKRAKKNLLLLGAFIFTVSPLLYSMSSNPIALVFVRMVHGLGIGAFTIAAFALVAELSPKPRLGEAMGVYGLSIMIATAIAPALSGYLVDIVGFDNTFYLASGFGFLSLALAGLMPRDAATKNPDSLLRGFKKAFKSPGVLLASYGIFILTLSYGVVVAFIPVHMINLGMSYTMVGGFFAVYALATIVTRPVMGKLSDKVGRVAVIIPMMLLTVAGIYSASLFASIREFYITAIAYGFGFGSAYAVLSAMVMDNVEPKNRGSAMAVFTSNFDLGIAAGSIGLGLAADSLGYAGLFRLTAWILFLGVGIFAAVSFLSHENKRAV